MGHHFLIIKYLKIQTQDYHCWVIALAKSLSCYPTNEAFSKSFYFLLDCLKQSVANMLCVSLIFLGFRWHPRTIQHCLIYQSGIMEPYSFCSKEGYCCGVGVSLQKGMEFSAVYFLIPFSTSASFSSLFFLCSPVL